MDIRVNFSALVPVLQLFANFFTINGVSVALIAIMLFFLWMFSELLQVAFDAFLRRIGRR